MKPHRFIAGLFGYELVKKRKLNDTLEQHLANVLLDRHIDLVVDVGANIGQYAKSLRLHGFGGRIVSFEPVAEAFEKLSEESSLDPNWWSFNLALGSQSASVEMHTFAASEFSSLLPISDYARERFGWRTNSTGMTSVEMRTLTEMWPEVSRFMEVPKVLLKLDTQGSDLDVVAGATGILDNVEAIQAEISHKAVYDGAPRYLDALAIFEDLGFEITGMYPVSRDKRSLAIVEYDCVMTRSLD